MWERVLSGFIKFSFRLEMFFPQLIKFFLNRKLKEYKENGALTDYNVKTKRKGKYHYIFEVDLFPNIKKGGDTHE